MYKPYVPHLITLCSTFNYLMFHSTAYILLGDLQEDQGTIINILIDLKISPQYRKPSPIRQHKWYMYPYVPLYSIHTLYWRTCNMTKLLLSNFFQSANFTTIHKTLFIFFHRYTGTTNIKIIYDCTSHVDDPDSAGQRV